MLPNQLCPIDKIFPIDVQLLPRARRLPVMNGKRLPFHLLHVLKQTKDLRLVKMLDAIDANDAVKF